LSNNIHYNIASLPKGEIPNKLRKNCLDYQESSRLHISLSRESKTFSQKEENETGEAVR